MLPFTRPESVSEEYQAGVLHTRNTAAQQGGRESPTALIISMTTDEPLLWPPDVLSLGPKTADW